MQAQLDLAKLALSESLEKEIRAKLGYLPARVRGGISHCGGVGIYVDEGRLVVGWAVGGTVVTPGRMSGDRDGSGQARGPWRVGREAHGRSKAVIPRATLLSNQSVPLTNLRNPSSHSSSRSSSG